MYKDSKLQFRLSEELKERIREYAQKRNISMSEAIRQLCEEAFKGEKEK